VADGRNKMALTVRSVNTVLRNKTVKVSTIQWAEAGVADYVSHISAGLCQNNGSGGQSK